jgi:hypothetical protein
MGKATRTEAEAHNLGSGPEKDRRGTACEVGESEAGSLKETNQPGSRYLLPEHSRLVSNAPTSVFEEVSGGVQAGFARAIALIHGTGWRWRSDGQCIMRERPCLKVGKSGKG